MNIYLCNEKSFDNNGLGFLTDCLSGYVTEYLNGEYSLSFSYPLNGYLSEYILEGNIIKSNVGNDNYQLFRINRIDKDFSILNVYAVHISYDLTNNFIEDSSPTNLSCDAFGKWLLSKTNFASDFEFYSDISTIASARYVRRNPIECFIGDIDNSMINLFKGEVERDNKIFKMLSRRGSDKGIKLYFGKNITSINISVDITNLYTRIMPIGYDGLLLPEKFIDSPLINDYPTPKIGKYTFDNIKYAPEDETAYATLEEAYEALRNATLELYDNGIDKPIINVKIDWLELSKTKEYFDKYSSLETVNLGDTITAELSGLNYTTRVIKTTYNVLNDRIESFEIGTFQPTFQSTVNKLNEKVDQVNPSSILSQAKQDATNLITSAMGGFVHKTQNELFIMDTDDPDTAQKVWRWNLNGLGYSRSGINGPYEIAMTQDGNIVADFITTGKLATNVIEGYDSLVTTVESNTSRSNDLETGLNDVKNAVDTINKTMLTQTDEAFTMLFEKTGIQKMVETLEKELDANISDSNVIKEYIHFEGAEITLGKTTSQTKLVIKNDRISFMTGDVESAYISENTLYITDSTVLNKLQIGHWVEQEDELHNLNTRWIGGN